MDIVTVLLLATAGIIGASGTAYWWGHSNGWAKGYHEGHDDGTRTAHLDRDLPATGTIVTPDVHLPEGVKPPFAELAAKRPVGDR